MDKKAIVSTLKKNAMLVVLVLVYLFFMVLTGGGIFRPTSFNALISQNAYVYILGCGMLMCMLTGGNIDLSCGAFVCLLGAISGVLMVIQGWGTGVSLLVVLLIGIVYGCGLGALVAYVRVPRTGHRYPAREFPHRFDRTVPGQFPECIFACRF